MYSVLVTRINLKFIPYYTDNLIKINVFTFQQLPYYGKYYYWSHQNKFKNYHPAILLQDSSNKMVPNRLQPEQIQFATHRSSKSTVSDELYGPNWICKAGCRCPQYRRLGVLDTLTKVWNNVARYILLYFIK